MHVDFVPAHAHIFVVAFVTRGTRGELLSTYTWLHGGM